MHFKAIFTICAVLGHKKFHSETWQVPACIYANITQQKAIKLWQKDQSLDSNEPCFDLVYFFQYSVTFHPFSCLCIQFTKFFLPLNCEMINETMSCKCRTFSILIFLSREMRYFDGEMKKFHPQFSSFRVVNNRR